MFLARLDGPGKKPRAMTLIKKAGNRKDAKNVRLNRRQKTIACFSSRSRRLPGKPLYSFMVTFLSAAGE
jgi:hypothetical protein